jgi:predicted O-methyltransferase YrrM
MLTKPDKIPEELFDFNLGFGKPLQRWTSMRWYGPLMYVFCRQIQAKKIMEIGVGQTSFWLGNAAKENGGCYYGFDIHAGKTKGVEKNMKEAGISCQLWGMDTRELTTQWVKENVGPIDFLFLDGDHSRDSVSHELEVLLPFLRVKWGYVFIHDIHSASREAWEWIGENLNLKSIEIPYNMGVGVLWKEKK